MTANQLTQKSLEAIQSAQRLASERQNTQLEQLHLFYALIDEQSDLNAQLFEKLGVDFLPLKVFKQTNFILITAVGIGIGLILISMLINIYAGFKKKDYEKAIFGCNGICGLIFYGSNGFPPLS